MLLTNQSKHILNQVWQWLIDSQNVRFYPQPPQSFSKSFATVLHPFFLQYGPCENILMIIILCSSTASNDLPQIGFDHAFHSDVIMTLVFSNDLRLRQGCLSRFENKRCDMIVRCHN